MPQETVAALFATALFVGLAATATALAVEPARRMLQRHCLLVAGAVAVGATAGSLYFSEVAGFIPCTLCWYQRIAMYPLGVVLALAAVRRDRSVLPYVATVATIGLGISAYHVYIQWFPEESNFCEITNPCSAKWVDAFGWVTIPQMAAMSFVLIIAACGFGMWADRPGESGRTAAGTADDDVAESAGPSEDVRP